MDYDEIAKDHALNNMDGTLVDIRKLEDIVTECQFIVDEYDCDIETGSVLAKNAYNGLNNDEKMYVNGRLRKTKPEGARKMYWSCFREFLDHA